MSGELQSVAAQCLLCGSPPSGPAYPYSTNWNGRTFNFLSCSSCGATFINPLPSAADFKTMYAREKYHEKFYEAPAVDPFETSLLEVAQFFPKTSTMLDFGCGNGSYLIAAQRAGYKCDGVELEPDAIAGAAALSGCEVFDLDELLGLGRAYDVIHLGDVLEHLPDPAAVMRVLRTLLKPRGVFFVEGPLEDNASAVFYASRFAGWLKKQLKPEGRGEFTPYHLTRTDACAQRAFFEKVLGYQVRSFSIHETGWPYKDAAKLSQSAADLVRAAIARLAILSQPMARLGGLALGNRFTAIVSPEDWSSLA